MCPPDMKVEVESSVSTMGFRNRGTPTAINANIRSKTTVANGSVAAPVTSLLKLSAIGFARLFHCILVAVSLASMVYFHSHAMSESSPALANNMNLRIAMGDAPPVGGGLDLDLNGPPARAARRKTSGNAPLESRDYLAPRKNEAVVVDDEIVRRCRRLNRDGDGDGDRKLRQKQALKQQCDPGWKNRVRFFLLGAAKSGTTSLHGYIVQHPLMVGPKMKETWCLTGRWNPSDPRCGKWYNKSELSSDPALLTGESTAEYMTMPGTVIPRIRSGFPNAKFVLTLREPVDRFHSHFQMMKRSKRSPSDLTLAQAVDVGMRQLHQAGLLPHFRFREGDDVVVVPGAVPTLADWDSADVDQGIFDSFHGSPEQIRAWDEYVFDLQSTFHRKRTEAQDVKAALSASIYSVPIERWFDEYDRSRFLIVNQEEMRDDLTSVMYRVFDHLGLSRLTVPNPEEKNTAVYESLKDDDVAVRVLKKLLDPYNRRLVRMLDGGDDEAAAVNDVGGGAAGRSDRVTNRWKDQWVYNINAATGATDEALNAQLSENDDGGGGGDGGSRSRFAYVWVVGGVNYEAPRPSHTAYLYSILVSASVLRERGSANDMVLYVQMSSASNATSLTAEEQRWLHHFGVEIRYLQSTAVQNFASINMAKAIIFNMTEYDRILYLDADVTVLGNLDYIFDQSVRGVFRGSLIVPENRSPLNGGFIMVTPGSYEKTQNHIANYFQTALDEDGNLIDKKLGWGHKMANNDPWLDWDGKRYASKWNFVAANLDQGFFYYWLKYVVKDVTILFRDYALHWGVDYSDTKKVVLLRNQSNPVDGLSNPLHRWDAACDYWICDYFHPFGEKNFRAKIWREAPAADFDPANPQQAFRSVKDFWFHRLSRLNDEISMGVDVSAWVPFAENPLGVLNSPFGDACPQDLGENKSGNPACDKKNHTKPSINSYLNEVSFKDLPSDKKKAAGHLGYKREEWDSDLPLPLFKKGWMELDGAQRNAANMLKLGYKFPGYIKKAPQVLYTEALPTLSPEGHFQYLVAWHGVKNATKNTIPKPMLLLDNKLLWCWNAKAGTTSMYQTILKPMKLYDKQPGQKTVRCQEDCYLSAWRLMEQNDKTISKHVMSAPAFTVVRNPWNRIQSAYVDKILSKEIFPTDQNPVGTLALATEEDKEKEPMTFPEFVNHAEKYPYVNEHWRPHSKHCLAAEKNQDNEDDVFHYDHILKMEDGLFPQLKNLFTLYGLPFPSNEITPRNTKASVNATKSMEENLVRFYQEAATDTVSMEDLVERVRKLFELDVKNHGYSFPEYHVQEENPSDI